MPKSLIERCIAAVSSMAVLIWNVKRDTPPSALSAESTFLTTVSGEPSRKAPARRPRGTTQQQWQLPALP
jgi:hypothetical protein